jgi:5'-3' exonuclease
VVPTSAASPSKESSSAAPRAKLKHKRKRKPTTAKKAAAGTCKLTAQVSLIYALG